MIRNEKQYKISKRKLRELNEHIEKITIDTTQDPLRNRVILASLNNSKDEIANDIVVYEFLKKNKEGVLKERMISELPSLITEYKIINSLTQRQLAEILGIKEQQLQRHESNGFKSVTFKNLLKFLDLIGLEVTIKDTRMTRTYRKIIKKKKTNS